MEHFSDEEALLTQLGYQRLASHKQSHARLRAQAHELRTSTEAGKATLGDFVNFVAHEIVIQHIFVADREYYPLFHHEMKLAP